MMRRILVLNSLSLPENLSQATLLLWTIPELPYHVPPDQSRPSLLRQRQRWLESSGCRKNSKFPEKTSSAVPKKSPVRSRSSLVNSFCPEPLLHQRAMVSSWWMGYFVGSCMSWSHRKWIYLILWSILCLYFSSALLIELKRAYNNRLNYSFGNKLMI